MTLLILGLGNDLIGDDAAGLLAASMLRGRFDRGTTVRRTGRSGLYLLDDLVGFDDAILIDSVLGDRPGRVRELRASRMKVAQVPSAHYAGLPEALALARHAGLRVPSRIRVFAVEIDAAQTIGSAPSERVRTAIPEIVNLVEQAAAAWGHPARRRRKREAAIRA